jgi:hypothetical protein
MRVSTDNKLGKTMQIATRKGFSRHPKLTRGRIRADNSGEVRMHRSATWAYLVIAVLAMASLALFVLASQAAPA